MSIGVSITIMGKTLELYWGKKTTKWVLAQVSATVLTIGIELKVKV